MRPPSPQVEGWSENPFPFQELDLPEFCTQVRNEDRQPRSKSRGLATIRMIQNKCSLLSGNYIAGYILAQLRIQAKASRRGMTNLEAIADLPMELFLLVCSSLLTMLNPPLSDWEILEFVHPMDLYHFIRSTRALRQLLLSKNAIPIWRRSFLEHPDVPFYPEDISAPKWASLLFGPAICDVSLNFEIFTTFLIFIFMLVMQECGVEDTMIDFNFRNRKCDSCDVSINLDFKVFIRLQLAYRI